MPKPLVVICGSMVHHARMLALQQTLEAHGIEAVAPADETVHRTQAARIRFKRRVSEEYFRLIRRSRVSAILVANYAKAGRKNYIGPNAFAEIAIAFDARKSIYLLRGIDPALKDELLAWGAIPLHGKLDALVKAVNARKLRSSSAPRRRSAHPIPARSGRRRRSRAAPGSPGYAPAAPA